MRDHRGRRRSHYGKRSLAETGNMMMKTRFGHNLRSRTPHAQYAESMLRCICHNVACLVMAVKELNVEPRYWTTDLAARLRALMDGVKIGPSTT
jgi:hypothetical protein